ncbi:hypothetical protein R3P38DRAFT_2808804 [Favolaschia claudopus]|uniref:Uncharacterized protein n=1 Tax=Favolaschia claudopus TaxID=2862362 RepID=A0AAV9ZGW9_9AGAR
MTVRKNIVGTKYVPNGPQTMVVSPQMPLTGLVDGAIWARTEIVGKNRNSGSAVNSPPIALVDPNTPIEAIRNPARQDQSRDVKVGDNPRAQTLSFGKEIEEHTIQQGSVRVNNGKQQDIGELAAPSCPLERKGNQARQLNTVEPIYKGLSQCIVMEHSLGDIAWNAEADVARLATGPQTSGIRIGTDSVGGNRAEHVGIGQNTPIRRGKRLAILPGNPLTDSVKEAPETGEFSPRSTPWEGIQPKIVIHPPETTGIHPQDLESSPIESTHRNRLLDSK